MQLMQKLKGAKMADQDAAFKIIANRFNMDENNIITKYVLRSSSSSQNGPDHTKRICSTTRLNFKTGKRKASA